MMSTGPIPVVTAGCLPPGFRKSSLAASTFPEIDPSFWRVATRSNRQKTLPTLRPRLEHPHAVASLFTFPKGSTPAPNIPLT